MNQIDLFIYSDSIALPRKNLQFSYNTFPFLLADIIKDQLDIKCNIYIRSLGGGKISEIRKLLIRDTGYFSYPRDKVCITIFNVGIVDCSPQPFTYHLRFIAKIPFINRVFWPYLRNFLRRHRRLLQSIYSFRRTSPKLFKYYFADMVRRANDNGMNVFSLATPLTSENAEFRSPGLKKSIDLYNNIKRQNNSCVHIPMDWYLDTNYLDEHHFNNLGHNQVANIIFSELSKFLIPNKCVHE